MLSSRNVFDDEVIQRAYVVRRTGRLKHQVAALKEARLEVVHAKQHWEERLDLRRHFCRGFFYEL